MDRPDQQLPRTGSTTSEQLMRIGTLLLQRFIQDRIQRQRSQMFPVLLQASQDASITMRRCGDALTREMQRLTDMAVGTGCTRELFFQVATEMFSDGNINWGRVAILFYFASNLVLKTLCHRQTRTIEGWTLDFIQENLMSWILEQGSWEGLLSYLGTPTWQAVTILSVTALMVSFIIWKKMG